MIPQLFLIIEMDSNPLFSLTFVKKYVSIILINSVSVRTETSLGWIF